MREVPVEGKEREEKTGIPSHSWVIKIFNTLLQERTGIHYFMHFYARTDFPFTHRLSSLSLIASRTGLPSCLISFFSPLREGVELLSVSQSK